MKTTKHIMISVILSLIFISYVNANSQDQECLNQTESIMKNFVDIQVIPGFVTGQIQIDKKAKGLSRFTSKGQTILVDAERVPLVTSKSKIFYPLQNLNGQMFQGVHIAIKSSRKDHRGVEIFDMTLRSDPKQSHNEINFFNLDYSPYYFKNYVLMNTPKERDKLEGRLWLLAHGENREEKWSHHTFLFPKISRLTSNSELEVFFETDFDNTNGGEGDFILNWIENSTSGVRIDTCIYFLVSE